jgi:hypothetical protein
MRAVGDHEYARLQSRCTILPVTAINFSATVPSVFSYNPGHLTLKFRLKVVAILKESGHDTNHLFLVKRAKVGSVAVTALEAVNMVHVIRVNSLSQSFPCESLSSL